MVLKETEKSTVYKSPEEFAHDIRQRLQQSFTLRPEVFPTDIDSIESLIQKSRKSVSERWRTDISDIIRSEALLWGEVLPDSHAKSIVTNRDLLEQKISIRQFSDLDVLRSIKPEYWYALVRASYERQQAETNLLYGWVRDMPDSAFDEIGMGRLEVLTALEIATKTGPLIHETYLKQMEILDDPKLRNVYIFGDGDGSKYLYQRKNADGDIEKFPYSDIFPDTWPQVVANLRSLAYKTTMLVANGKLPPTYAALSGLLDQIAHTYGSRETDVSLLKETWDELLLSTYEFIAANCPVDVSIQFNSYLSSFDGNVDAEIRIGLKTPKTQAMLEELLPYRDIAREYASHYDGMLTKPTLPVRINLENLLYGVGSNLYWRTQGEAADSTIVCYIDSTQDMANEILLPLHEKIFGSEDSSFLDTYTKSLVWHELGHTVLSTSDKTIEDRIGTGTGASMIEELKADVMGYVIAGRVVQSKEMLEVLVTYCLDYIINRDSTDGYGTSMYAGGGAVILTSLLESGILVKKGNIYGIEDAERGFLLLKDIADTICTVYADPTMTPEKIETWAKQLGELRKNMKLVDLLDFVQK